MVPQRLPNVRGWSLPAVLVLVLPGCVGLHAPHTDPRAAPTLPDLTAHYTFVHRIGDITWRGNLDLRPLPTRLLMDRDQELRPAWELETWVNFTIPAAVLGPPAQQDFVSKERTVLAFDGSLHVVRADTSCENCTSKTVYTTWGLQGAPAPFGIAWPALVQDGRMEYQVDGANTTAQVLEKDGWMALAPGSVMPVGGADADARYRFDNPWLPAQVYARHDLPGIPMYEEWFNRTSLAIGAPHEPIKAWPKQATAESRPGPDRYLPGQASEAHGMRVTYLDLVEELRRREPQASDDLDHGCIGFGATYSAGGIYPSGPLAPLRDPADTVGLSSDALGLSIVVVRNHTLLQYHITYSPGPTGIGAAERALGLTQEYQTKRDIGRFPSGYEFQCRSLPLALAAPIQGGRAAWKLPLPETGVPCGDLLWFRSMSRTGTTSTNGAALLGFQLVLGPEGTDRARDVVGGLGGMVQFSVESGLLETLAVTKGDLAGLDAGLASQAPRAMPTLKLPTALEAPHFLCVTPDLVEGLPPPTPSAWAQDAWSGPPGRL